MIVHNRIDLETRGEMSGRVTRQESQLELARTRLEFTKKSPIYAGTKLYNAIPKEQ